MELKKDNFKRHEVKFILNNKAKSKFLMRNNLSKLFPDRIVESTYFDTKDLNFFNLSEEGVTPRKKIRLRGYNNGELDNLEIKMTKNYHREKIIIKNFKFKYKTFHTILKKFGIKNIVEKKVRVKYLRSYYELQGVGRITIDRNIEFFSPERNFHNPKKINENILEVKIKNEKFDKNNIEQIINLKEIRFSKYCIGINCLRNSN